MTPLDIAVKYILPEKRMRLSQFARLNDPFELMSYNQGGAEERYVFKMLRDHWEKSLGVLCFGKHWKSPVMWAHYARSHTGVCLGFDVPDEMPKQIIYEPERIKWAVDLAKPIRGIDISLLEKVITTKYAQWAYEEEWRLFGELKDADPSSGEYYLNFGPALTLREIIVGARCQNSVGSFKKLAGEVERTVEIIKARPAFETFTMTRQMKVSKITVLPKQHLRAPSNGASGLSNLLTNSASDIGR
ncbi:DUF2971 domain-containing protein [Variovorax sp. HJSM1_2]